MGYTELINRLKEKDQKALELIIQNYNHYVAAVVYSILKDCLPEIDIQALVNQVFFLLCENYPVREEVLGDVDESLDRILLKNIIYRALRSLKQEEQTLIIRYYFQGMSMKEISQKTKQPEATVKTKIRRTRMKLKKILEKEGIFNENDLQ